MISRALIVDCRANGGLGFPQLHVRDFERDLSYIFASQHRSTWRST
jgi:hypothetical protein